MTDTVVLKAEHRESGSKNAAKTRSQGMLPAVIYGHKQEPEAVAVDKKAILDGLNNGHRLFELQFDGKSEILLVKDLQYDHYGIEILHADLMRVDLNEKAQVTVNIELKGDLKNGMLDIAHDSIDINCVVTKIPESFEVSIRELEIGDTIYAKDIELPAGAELITDPEAAIVSCHAVTAAPEEEVEGEEGAAEPEVITEKVSEEE